MTDAWKLRRDYNMENLYCNDDWRSQIYSGELELIDSL